MKRIFLIVLLALIFVSCGSKYEPLAYQEGDVSALCRVNGEYDIKIEKREGERVLSISEPSALSSVSFIINNEECVAISDGTKIPLERDKMTGIVALCSIFDLDMECLSSSSIDDNGDSTLCFVKDEIAYLVSYGQDNLPKHIQISAPSFTHEVEILELQ